MSNHHLKNNRTKLAISGTRLSTRLAIAMVSLVVVTTAVLSFITYHSVTEVAVPRALDRLATKAMLIASNLETVASSVGQDAITFQSSSGVAQLGAVRSAIPFMQEKDRDIRQDVAARLSRVLKAKLEYAQMRIIGVADGGRELVRVDRGGPGGSIRIVPDAELMQVGDREYFKRVLGKPRHNVYASPMVPQDGGVGRSAKPVLYVAVPLWIAGDQVQGLGVIDVDLGPRFARILADKDPENEIFIADGAGEYLLHSGRDRRLPLDAARPERVQNDFPGFDGALATGAVNGSGIWKHRNGAQFGVGWATVNLAGGSAVTVLVAANAAYLNHGLDVVSSAAQIGGGVAVLLALLFAVLLARSLSGPLVQITDAVKGLSRGELMALPTGGGAEIEVLSATFADMATELRSKQSLLENTIASISDPVLVADERGQIVVANAAAQRLLGIVPGVGTTESATRLEYFSPDGATPLPFTDSALARALRGEAVDDQEFIVRSQAPSAQAYIVANARPLKDGSGESRGAVAVLRNITEHRHAHQALVDSEQMAQAIIKTALDAFVQTDGSCVILNWSPHAEALMGWTRAEAIGRSAEELLFPEAQRAVHRQWVENFLRGVTGDAVGGRYETPLLHKDGREFFAEVSLTALRHNGGYIVNAFVRDITAKRAAEEQLFQSQKMESVGQLTGGIAHDFNNMLTVITGTIEILADAVKENPGLAAITKMISDAADRASQLTANLLAFARKQPLRPLEIEVNALVEEVVKLLSPTLGRQIEIRTTLSDQVWLALADPGQLTSALVNLAINARDAMPSGGELLFTTRNVSLDGNEGASGELEAGDYVVIEVADSGAGIPAAIRDRIFDPFFSTKQLGTGTGLGLSMVFGFAKQSGGSVVVDSEEGKGACFRIYLPRAPAEPSEMAAADAARQGDDGELRGGSETILCVEDDDVVRAHVVARLGSLGYKLIVASNAAEALEIVNAGTAFDLLFTDIVMPGAMNGRQLAETVAKLRRPLRVLYTSGNTFDAFTSSERLSEGVLLLHKPYRKADLARMVRLALDRAIDHMGDPVPLPYSVQDDVERFQRKYPPKPR